VHRRLFSVRASSDVLSITALALRKEPFCVYAFVSQQELVTTPLLIGALIPVYDWSHDCQCWSLPWHLWDSNWTGCRRQRHCASPCGSKLSTRSLLRASSTSLPNAELANLLPLGTLARSRSARIIALLLPCEANGSTLRSLPGVWTNELVLCPKRLLGGGGRSPP